MNTEQIAPALESVRDAVESYPSAALFELHREGYQSLFEILLACIISVRTLEKDTLAVSRRLFAVARTPAELSALSDDELLPLLEGSTFPEPKVGQLKGIAEYAERDFAGALPADYDTLLRLHGVGPKCASLAIGVATGETPHTPVDTHVHRVANRWGIVATKTPEKTMDALDAVLQPAERIEINRLLVPFGKYICTGGTLPPRCSTCPLREVCDRVGVTRSR
ncbi:MAG: endonuclease III [Fibrella sp.]|nr:endonuclease III [Armatimonadota bacterium]